MKKNKAIILLAGQLRTFDSPIVRQSWHKFITENDVCVYGSFWDNRGRSAWSIKEGIAKHNNDDEVVSIDLIKDVFRTENIKLNNHAEFMRSLPPQYSVFSDSPYFGCLFSQGFLRNQVCSMLESDSSSPDGVTCTITRPDLIWIRTPPQSLFVSSDALYHADSPQAYHPNRVYDTVLSSNKKTILKIGKLYSDIDEMIKTIHSSHNTSLHPHDTCRIYYNYVVNNNIPIVGWDFLYGDVFRQESDISLYEQSYAQQKLWCMT